MLDKLKRYIGYNVGQETDEIRRKWEENTEAIIYKFAEKSCKPILGSIGFYVALIIFFGSIAGTAIMHFTPMFDKMILGIIALKDDGMVFNIWKQPSFPFYVNMYPFNYTNWEAFIEGREKAKIQELGPYVFEEYSMMTNLEFEGKGLLSYTENRTHRFMPERSVGLLNETIISPNVVYISAVSILKNQGYVKQFSAGMLMSTLRTKLFSEISLDKLFFGYDDKFSLLARQLQGKEGGNSEAFGLLSSRNGIGIDRLTIGTGVPNVDDLGVIHRYNGREELQWNGPECNRLDASDGTLFPAKDVLGDKIHAFATPACRRVTMNYDSDTWANDLPARRFRLDKKMFFNSTENPDNACFCQENCPPNGAFSTSPCFFGSPVVVSFPHFLYGDPALREDFEGLQPDQDKHDFYMDLHEIGIPLEGHTRVQMNIMINHAKHMKHLKNLKNGLILPLAWLDVEIGYINGDARVLLWHVTYTANILRFIFKWGSPTMAILTAYLLYRNYLASKKQR